MAYQQVNYPLLAEVTPSVRRYKYSAISMMVSCKYLTVPVGGVTTDAHDIGNLRPAWYSVQLKARFQFSGGTPSAACYRPDGRKFCF